MRNIIRALIFCTIAVGIFGSSLELRAQEASGQDYQAQTDKFFELLQQDKSSDAVDFLFNSNPMLKKMPDKADQLKAQFTALRNLAGHYVSHTLLVESKVGDIYVYQHFFVAYERQPISVRVSYYKPGATWVCQSLQFDTDVDDAIQKNADAKIKTTLK